MEEYVYDNTNRKKTFLVRFTDEEHELYAMNLLSLKSLSTKLLLKNFLRKMTKLNNNDYVVSTVQCSFFFTVN